MYPTFFRLPSISPFFSQVFYFIGYRKQLTFCRVVYYMNTVIVLLKSYFRKVIKVICRQYMVSYDLFMFLRFFFYLIYLKRKFQQYFLKFFNKHEKKKRKKTSRPDLSILKLILGIHIKELVLSRAKFVLRIKHKFLGNPINFFQSSIIFFILIRATFPVQNSRLLKMFVAFGFGNFYSMELLKASKYSSFVFYHCFCHCLRP